MKLIVFEEDEAQMWHSSALSKERLTGDKTFYTFEKTESIKNFNVRTLDNNVATNYNFDP
ncbi:hypothetical protein T05_7340 [Trichinella murrelli]|uniref:Uncharacterized protein n=1 Tax=Trichinella murrelli TaxID=144512 RepID=A0A0V0U6X3_9BILA|nr:hypothetical protein T05_7340 [Trichinella murrelli]